jgi:flavodoxin
MNLIKGVDTMNYKVVYFTRTGNSRRVAEKLAAALSVEAAEIKDNMNWKGIFGFIRGGYYSTKDKDVEIQIPHNLDDADELIVVTPIWAGKAAPAVRAFLKNRSLEKIHLVATSSGSIINERSGYKSVSDIVKSKNNEEEVIGSLLNMLK